MLFGSSKKAFGASSLMPGDQPGSPIQQWPTQVMDPAAREPSSGHKIDWMGVFADALAGAAGKEGPYAAQMERERKQRMLLAQDQRQRSLDMTDWQQKQEWTRAHPAPVNNDTVNDYNFIRQQQGEEAAANYLKRVSDPDVTVPLPNGQVYIGPRSGMAAALGQGGQAAAPMKPIGKLTPLGSGGPMQPASGGFLR